ncbi:hypothetical protein C8A00DRAFT_16256 [Chaetomidium leptoderma]|uniref:Uncharacterized protein n=1 Tax=Chaetomidium leptoderma TaxID=669021 RepID=A0AAN6VJF8_9PEZI|nr:hypothetical protein C8A00DRAFT_16256 [Chaetomidium leptoderma]
MFTHTLLLTLLLTLLTLTLAAPSSQPWYEKYHQRRVIVPQSYYEGLSLRRQQNPIKPNAVRDVVCLDPKTRFVLYDEHAASLAICSSIAGSSATRCEGAPRETVGRSGKAVFTLQATERDSSGGGAGITLSKAAWMGCVAAAREACPEGSFRGVCVGGATRGDVQFTLTSL